MQTLRPSLCGNAGVPHCGGRGFPDDSKAEQGIILVLQVISDDAVRAWKRSDQLRAHTRSTRPRLARLRTSIAERFTAALSGGLASTIRQTGRWSRLASLSL